MSTYGDQTHCENLDCIGRLEISQTGYLLTHPRINAQIDVGITSNRNLELISSACSLGSDEHAHARSLAQTLRCLHTHSVKVDEGSVCSLDTYVSMGGYWRCLRICHTYQTGADPGFLEGGHSM